MISSIHYRPDGSHDEASIAVATTKSVGSGGFLLVAVSRVGATVASMGVSNVVAVCPAVIFVVVVTNSASATVVVVLLVARAPTGSIVASGGLGCKLGAKVLDFGGLGSELAKEFRVGLG
jgi:hypothetical protein